VAFAPPPPREPSETTRELIYKYTGKQKAQLIVGVCFVLFGGPMSCLFGWGIPGQLALALTGRPVQATVTQARVDTSVEINGENPVVVDIAFEEAGVKREARTTFTGRRIDEFNVGSTVPATAASINSDWVQLDGGSYATFGWFGGFAFIFPLAGLFLSFAAVRGNRREILAYREGIAAPGKVVKSGPDLQVEVNGTHPWEVRWEFDVEGTTYQGELSHMRASLLAHFKVGAEVTVLYLRHKPSVNTLYLE
jgi:hypothetical protein